MLPPKPMKSLISGAGQPGDNPQSSSDTLAQDWAKVVPADKIKLADELVKILGKYIDTNE